ncbi:MAG: DUF2070 family protein [Nitrososphaeria archaeon]
MQKTNQNVSTLFKVLFSLPSNKYVLPAFHLTLFVIIQVLITAVYKGDVRLIPIGFVGVLVYLYALRYLTGKRVSFSTIRRVSATHSFFLLLTFLTLLINIIFLRPIFIFVSSLSAVFSFSYIVLRGEFLEGRIEPLVSLLFYYFFLLLPIYRPIEKSFDYTELYFWLAAFAITALFYYTVDRLTLNKVGVKLSNVAQKVLDAWMVEYSEGFEKLLEANSIQIKTKTYCLKLVNDDGSSHCILVPPVHPGPFKGVGSYNITEVLAKHFKEMGFKDVIVLHSASNHDMNIPSKAAVAEYLKQLDSNPAEQILDKFKVFSEESTYFEYNGLSTNACDFVILFPKVTMDDLPMGYMQKLFQENQKRKKPIILVDSHSNLSNFVGNIDFYEPLRFQAPEADSEALFFALEKLDSSFMEEVGGCGAYRIDLSDGNSKLKILYVDSNNALPEAKEVIQKSTGYLVVTSDTHVIKTLANRKGYWAFGELTDPQIVIKIIQKNPELKLNKVKASLLIWDNEIKVIGEEGLEKLKQAMSSSLNKFKYYVIAISALFVIAIFL